MKDAAADPPPEQVLYQDADLVPGRRTRLVGSEADHGKRSLRLRSGDPVHLVNGRGSRYQGRVVDLGKQFLEIEVVSEEALPVWPRRPIWLGAGVLRSTRMDTLVEKASELGVTRFVPLLLERSVARPGEEGAKEERWHRIAIESLKQSRRARLMDVDPPRGLDAFVGDLPPGTMLWVADPEGEDPVLAARGASTGPLALVVGPEGGLSPRERSFVTGRKALLVSLGGNRLRSETAAMTLLTAALVTLGELGNRTAG
jgi:16S rRNA (uracil1498-N3)-methyltransferase